MRLEAEDDAGNSYVVPGGTESRGDADPVVGRWDLVPPPGVEPGLLRLRLFFDEWSQPAGSGESVEDKRERARRWIDILEAQLAAAEHRHVLADLMYTSDERTTAIARVVESVDLSEFQAHFVADFSLGRMTEKSRQHLREQLSGFQTQLRELGD